MNSCYNSYHLDEVLLEITRPSFAHNVILVEFKAAAPVDISEVSCGQFDDVQFEGLLHEDDVVLRHAKAVEVAREQGGAERNGANLFHLAEGWLLLFFIYNTLVVMLGQ